MITIGGGQTGPVWFSGLDLGQMSDFSAIVCVERSDIPDPEHEGRTVYAYAVRHLHRWPLGTSYPAIVADVVALFNKPPLAGSVLAIDQTGVGRPVVEMVRAAKPAATLRPFSITSGEAPGRADTVPKKDLVGAVQAALGTGRLKFAEGLPLTPVLVKELETFRVKVTADRHEVFEAWREGDKDDLVLGLALALHVARIPPVVAYIAELPAARVTPRRFGSRWSW